MKILITGGAGFIGAHVASRLNALDHQVLALDSFQNSYTPDTTPTLQADLKFRSEILLPDVRVQRCDLTDRGLVQDLVTDFAPDIVIHLAAIPLPNIAQTQIEATRRNLLDGLINLLDAVDRSRSVGRFVFVSSSMVYGNFNQDPMPEDGAKDPINFYGGMKYAGEILSRAFLRTTDTQCTIVRPSTVYGPTDIHNRVTKLFCENATLGRALKINNGAQTFLDFTYVDDLVSGLVLAATHPHADNETFNMTFGRSHNLLELVDQIRKFFPNVKTEQTTSNDKYCPSRGTLSIDKARRMLAFEPEWTLSRGIEHYLAHISRQLQPRGV